MVLWAWQIYWICLHEYRGSTPVILAIEEGEKARHQAAVSVDCPWRQMSLVDILVYEIKVSDFEPEFYSVPTRFQSISHYEFWYDTMVRLQTVYQSWICHDNHDNDGMEAGIESVRTRAIINWFIFTFLDDYSGEPRKLALMVSSIMFGTVRPRSSL